MEPSLAVSEEELERRAREFLASTEGLRRSLPPEVAEAVQRDVGMLGGLLYRLLKHYETMSNVRFADEARLVVSFIAFLLASTFLSLTASLASEGLSEEDAAALALTAVASPQFVQEVSVPLKAFAIMFREGGEKKHV